MKAFICDRCGAIFNEQPHTGLFLYRFVQNNSTAGEMIDLCHDCQEDLIDFLDRGREPKVWMDGKPCTWFDKYRDRRKRFDEYCDRRNKEGTHENTSSS